MRQAPVERLWERSREGRKETKTAKLSKQNRKERMGNQPGEKGKGLNEREGAPGKAAVRQSREESGKEETEAE